MVRKRGFGIEYWPFGESQKKTLTSEKRCMKILPDESLPHKLHVDFGAEYEVWTSRDKGWLGKKNGELLKLMTDDSFDIFIPIERNLPFH